MRCSDCSKTIRPVVALDIDGTLCDYHGHFRNFAEHYLGRPLPKDHNGNGEFSDSLGLPKHLYREIKLAYRQGGLKRTIPIYPGADELVRRLVAADIEVWLTTTRPYLRLDNIDPDTREWLRRNDIKGWSGLLYDKDKYRVLASELVDRERIIGVVDDLPEQVDAAASLGLPVWQRHTRYNSGARREGFGSLLDLADHLVGEAERWYRHH